MGDVLKVLLIACGWTLGSSVAAILILSLPAVLDLVDGYAWGELTGRLVLRVAPIFCGAGMLFGFKRRKIALGITGVVLAGFVAASVYAFWLATHRPAHVEATT